MKLRLIQLFVCFFCMVCTSSAQVQDTLSTSISYDLTAEAAVGTGDYTAYQLTANRYHTLATRANTAYLRGAMNIEHPFSDNLTLSGCVDAIAAVHADHKAYLQQCYVNLSWKSFFVEAGSRELAPVLRDPQLSSGAFVKGNNAKPMPQIHFGTNGFWTIPHTKEWLQVNFDFGYGKFMDSGYREEMFWQGGSINQSYAKGIWYHQKHLYFRTNPEKRFFITAGIEHAVQFGGAIHTFINGHESIKEKPVGLRTFWNVILPLGDRDYYEDDALEDWIYGNHVGSMTIQLGWNINRKHLLQAYYDDPFEDGSGMRKGNGWDGLWGLQYQNKAEGHQYVRKAVVEYFQTTNQSGPLHCDSGDYPEPARSQISDFVTGDDNYYNHMSYNSYSHYGMAIGNPLITSPIYNKDGYSGFHDNRVKVWHLGINGEISDQVSYLIKGSYCEGWGTYAIPLASKHYSFGALFQGTYQLDCWHFSAAYAFDNGNIFGDTSTFNFKISYHGKIL